MKKIIICGLLVQIIFSSLALGQYDHRWYGGKTSSGNSILTLFTQDKDDLKIQLDSLIQLKMGNYHFTMCDSNGDIQFFTNGLHIYNRKGKIMENGDSINTCINANGFSESGIFYNRRLIFEAAGAYDDPVGCLAIPYPGKNNEFLFFNSCYYQDSMFRNVITLSYAHINMNLNSGSGKVVSKENEILRGLNLGNTTLFKHANGRDWWLLTYLNTRNNFYFYLIDPNGVHFSKTLTCGPYIKGFSSYYQDKISPDGSLFAKIDECYLLSLYQLDRCVAKLEYIRSINFENTFSCDEDFICSNSPPSCLRGVEFSSNSKILYIIDVYNHLYQLDLISYKLNEIFNSTAILEYCQLLTNQTILIGNPARFSPSNTYVHVLRRPNLKGLSADMDINSIVLPQELESEVQQTPNYLLGKVTGTVCDSL